MDPRSASLSRPDQRDFSYATAPLRVLLAEDNAADVGLVEEAFAHHAIRAQLDVFRNGEEVLRQLERIGSGDSPSPDIVLLDLNLPRVSGHAILRRIREIAALRHVPVLIVSSSTAQRDRQEAERLGATEYFCKPSDLDEFMNLGALVRRLTRRSS